MAKDYNTFSDVSTGDVYTAAAHNLILENVENYRVPPMCSLYLTSLAVNTTPLTIGDTGSGGTWTEEVDTDSMHDASTNPARITLNTAGIYLITGSMLGGTGNIGAYMQLNINGTTIVQNTIADHASYFARGQAVMTYSASASQYVELVAASSSALTCDMRLSAVWLGQAS